MKKAISLLLCALLVLLCACKGEKEGAASEDVEMSQEEQKAAVSMFDLKTAMLAADDTFPEMLYVSDSDNNAAELFKYISEDFDYSKLEHFFLAYSSDSSNPSGEVVVIALKDTEDLAEAEKALKAHVDYRVRLYEEYDPNSVSRVKGAMIFTREQYAVLIIAENAGAVKSAFEDFISD